MRYAAIGDSFTEGVGDPTPDGGVRGWADLVAAGLAAAHEEVWYANFAIRGRLIEPIVTDQLDAALSLDPAPTLLTLNGGGNDMLRPGADAARLVELTHRAVRRAVDAGAHVVLISGADPSARLPLGARIRALGTELTAALEPLGREEGVTFVNAFGDEEIRRAPYWGEDRLHLNSHGHRRVADLVLAALGHAEDPRPGALPDPATTARARRVVDELRFYGAHVAPWLGRRLRGRSSGDGRVPKHPAWQRVAPAASDEPATGDRAR